MFGLAGRRQDNDVEHVVIHSCRTGAGDLNTKTPPRQRCLHENSTEGSGGECLLARGQWSVQPELEVTLQKVAYS